MTDILNSILNSYWDLCIPIRTDKIANSLGLTLQPMINDYSDHLRLYFKDGRRIIEYNKKDTTQDIRKYIAFGISKFVNSKVSLNEVQKFDDSIFKQKENLSHIWDIDFAMKMIVPDSALKFMVHKEKVYDPSNLARKFNTDSEIITLRLKECHLL